MNRAAQWRWAILLSVLLLTVVAIFYPLDEVVEVHAAPVDRPVTQAKVDKPIKSIVEDPLLGIEVTDVDPFAPRTWLAPIVPEPVIPVQPAAVLPAPILPAGPPPLPFRFVGSMNDNEEQVVYLGRGEQALVARHGETLEGIYKVLSITAQHIEFEHLPTGEKQTLLFSASNN